MMVRAMDEYKRILMGMGFFPPFHDVDEEIKAKAQREADLIAWGPGGPESFVWTPVKRKAKVEPSAIATGGAQLV